MIGINDSKSNLILDHTHEYNQSCDVAKTSYDQKVKQRQNRKGQSFN